MGDPVGGDVSDPVDGPMGEEDGGGTHTQSRLWMFAGERLVNESSNNTEGA